TATAGSVPASTIPLTSATAPDDASRLSPHARAPKPAAAASACHTTRPLPPPSTFHAAQNSSSAAAGTSCPPPVGAVAKPIDPGRCPCPTCEPSGTSQSASAPMTPRDARSAAVVATAKTTGPLLRPVGATVTSLSHATAGGLPTG